MKAFTIRSFWIARTLGQCCCTVPKNRPVPVTCPAYSCPETILCRRMCAATCATSYPSTGFSWSTRSRWSKTIVVPPSNRCTTGRNPLLSSTRRRLTANTPCCTTITSKLKSITTNQIRPTTSHV